MNVLLIMNTKSGTLSSPEQQKALLAAFREAGLNVTVRNVETEPELTDAVRTHLENHYGTVVAAGGDGTVSSVAAMLVGTSINLGVIPGGTLNHFARDLKIPHDFAGAVRVIKTGFTKRVDVASVNGRMFLNNSGLGLYPRMVLKREEIRKRGFRKLTALMVAAVLTLRRFPRHRVRVVLKERAIKSRTPFVFVGNNPYEFEGVHFGARSRLDTGQLCVCIARGTHRLVLLRAVFQMVWRGLRGVRDLDVIYTSEASIETRSAVVPVSLDGEVVRLPTPLRYEIRPGALTVLVPAPGEPG